MKSLLDKKWIKKYLKIAKTLADDNDACYSRKIGVVLVSSNNRIMSLGYNGSIEGAPHNDSAEYLAHLWDNLLTEEQRKFLQEKFPEKFAQNVEIIPCASSKEAMKFASCFNGCKQCPRKILNIPSGQNLELCTCAHAERNCLASASKLGVSTENSTMYCWCSCPCHECTIQIIQSGVKNVVCLKGDVDYSRSSRYLFKFANVELIEVNESIINEI